MGSILKTGASFTSARPAQRDTLRDLSGKSLCMYVEMRYLRRSSGEDGHCLVGDLNDRQLLRRAEVLKESRKRNS